MFFTVIAAPLFHTVPIRPDTMPEYCSLSPVPLRILNILSLQANS